MADPLSATVEYAADGRSTRLAYRWHDRPPAEAGRDPIALVCLHGSMCDSSFYDGLDGALPGCRALCIDLPGHGASEAVADVASAGAPTSMEEMASAVRALLSTLCITRSDWAISGHSLGGAVALLVLELIATGSTGEQLPRFFLSFEGNATPACCAENGLSRRVAAMPEPPSTEKVLQMVSSAPFWEVSARRVGDTLGLLTHRIWISLVEWCDGRTLDGATLEQMQRRVPLRFVYGSTSGKYHARNVAAHAAHPDAAAACIEGAGHFMLTDNPTATISAIRGLLRGLL